MSLYPVHSIAVIFSAKRNANDADGYTIAAQMMENLAKKQNGFLGIDSVRADDGHGITISYWRTQADAAAWRDNEEHSAMRDKGRALWYDEYSLHITSIERAYEWHHNA